MFKLIDVLTLETVAVTQVPSAHDRYLAEAFANSLQEVLAGDKAALGAACSYMRDEILSAAGSAATEFNQTQPKDRRFLDDFIGRFRWRPTEGCPDELISHINFANPELILKEKIQVARVHAAEGEYTIELCHPETIAITLHLNGPGRGVFPNIKGMLDRRQAIKLIEATGMQVRGVGYERESGHYHFHYRNTPATLFPRFSI